MTARWIGLFAGLAGFAVTLALPAPTGMPEPAWIVAGLVVWMAAWWMTEAIPLTATALLPFVVLPFAGVMTANETASSYYSPTLFLILGGAFIALAIERTGLHRRLALALLDRIGSAGGSGRLLFAFMLASGILSMAISNTSTALIMMPMAIAVLEAGGIHEEEHGGLSGALPMGIAFAASIGGLGTIVGSPTNAIAVALLDTMIGLHISFAQWSAIGVPVVLLGIPLAAWIIARTQQVSRHRFDVAAARRAIHVAEEWTRPERRLIPLVTLAFLLWIFTPLLAPELPKGSLTDGTIAVAVGLLLFIVPDGTGRMLLTWQEANRAPWDVIMMFGGGLALAEGMGESGLADWLGQALLPLSAVPLPVVALAIVAMVILITEFASNVATASGIMPVVASLSVALGADPLLLAMPAALAASWGFMLPAGTGPNAIAWATERISLPRMLRAGFLLDLAGVPLLVGVVWAVAMLSGGSS
ncbi:SLC13 family permease [Novosphingobium album (ex Liu et al. 2023)]|uniref:DASS family sodium-coupled anion symporter n=1 Tax=Novosphingobium album (ex Liu et al. 2023) TaxID=3031130 RepID=A0ABT5WJK4_9SPHN|nr:DASS family sodium-coupled anion symporter [Novosphingobium album (ex Liu et al. 2023)]MDE8650221.1 DASS family sodium-coupled anion symporter [Novosphingobium album (ex Liu et al. 2023)]